MRKVFCLLVVVLAGAPLANAQKIIRESATPSPTPFESRPVAPNVGQPVPAVAPAAVPVKTAAVPESTTSNVYRSSDYGFQIGFPADWRVTGDDFGEYLRTQGYDLSLRAPDDLSAVGKARINRSLQNVTVLLTAVHTQADAKEGAIMRVSVEDISAVPEVEDAVDYFDLMRSQFGSMKLPSDFKYSETQAEELGKKQFAFLDIPSSAGKKRLYATVRGRKAIMFALTYRGDADLQTMRRILAAGDFYIK